MTMVFVIVATVMIDLLVLRIVTAVILHNFVSSDSERIRFQLQFERCVRARAASGNATGFFCDHMHLLSLQTHTHLLTAMPVRLASTFPE